VKHEGGFCGETGRGVKVYNCTEDSGVVTDTKGGRMHMIPVRIDPIILKRCFPNPEPYPGQQFGVRREALRVYRKKIRLLGSSGA